MRAQSAILPAPRLLLAFVVGGLREIGEPARKALIVDLAEPSLRARVACVADDAVPRCRRLRRSRRRRLCHDGRRSARPLTTALRGGGIGTMLFYPMQAVRPSRTGDWS